MCGRALGWEEEPEREAAEERLADAHLGKPSCGQ